MLKANDLRIGNWLLYENSDGEIITSKVNWQDFRFISKDEHEFNEWHKPIELNGLLLSTLEKLNEFLMVDKIGFVIFKRGYAHQFVREDYQYLHELQNLYFVLTGEELHVEL
jgi:hypothetical protein